MLANVAEAVQVPEAQKTEEIAALAKRLRQAGRMVDTELVIVTARQSPVARDLRLVLALIEVAHHGTLIANQFMLIGEQLAHIDVVGIDCGRSAANLSAMAQLAGSQLLHAVNAFASRDLVLAQRIDVEDDEVDQLNREVFEATLTLEDGSRLRESMLRHVLIARSVERIADNAVDIAEQAAFLVTGQRLEFTDASRPRRRTLQRP